MSEEITTEKIMVILEKAGDSNPTSRAAVIKFHEGIDNMQAAAILWANHKKPFDIFVRYASAVDLGYRIAVSAPALGDLREKIEKYLNHLMENWDAYQAGIKVDEVITISSAADQILALLSGKSIAEGGTKR